MVVRRLISASLPPIVAWRRKRDASVAFGICTAITSGGVSAAGQLRVDATGAPPLPPQAAPAKTRTSGRTAAPREKRATRPASISKF